MTFGCRPHSQGGGRWEGGGFPQIRAVMNLVIYVCPWLIRAPKMFQLCINQLVVWFVQVRVNN